MAAIFAAKLREARIRRDTGLELQRGRKIKQADRIDVAGHGVEIAHGRRFSASLARRQNFATPLSVSSVRPTISEGETMADLASVRAEIDQARKLVGRLQLTCVGLGSRALRPTAVKPDP